MFGRLLYCASTKTCQAFYFAHLAASKCWHCVLNRTELHFCNSFVLILSFLICYV